MIPKNCVKMQQWSSRQQSTPRKHSFRNDEIDSETQPSISLNSAEICMKEVVQDDPDFGTFMLHVLFFFFLSFFF